MTARSTFGSNGTDKLYRFTNYINDVAETDIDFPVLKLRKTALIRLD